jgi:hypothetical protein
MQKTTFALSAILCLSPIGAGLKAQVADQPKKDYSNCPLVTHMMAFDANHDGKLTREELTDDRLHRLFDQADVNHQGFVTKDQLTALAAKLDAELPAIAGEPDGPDVRGGPVGRGFGGPRAPGQIMPPPLAEALHLTAEQRSQLAELQKQVDARMATILTPSQLKQLKAGPGHHERTLPPPQ